LNLLISSKSFFFFFLMKSLGFSIYKIMSSANRDNYSCLIAQGLLGLMLRTKTLSILPLHFFFSFLPKQLVSPVQIQQVGKINYHFMGRY